MSELSKEQVERAIGSIGRRDYRDPHIQKIAREAMKRKKKKEKPTPPVSKPTPSRPSSSSSRSKSRHSGGGSSSSPSRSSSEYYYIKPGEYEGVHGIISERAEAPSGRGWKRVSKEEYEEHKRKAREYHERKEKEKLERRIRHGDKTALKEWEKRYGKPEVTEVVTTKNPKTGERVEIPVARTPYGTYIYEIGGKVKELKPAIGKREESVLGDIAREYHKSVIGKSPRYAVSYGSVKKQEFGRYAVAEAYADIKRGRKQAWKTPDDKLIIVEGTSPPYGMSEKKAKEMGYERISPKNIEIKEGGLSATIPVGISKAPEKTPSAIGKATPEEVVGAIRGATKMGVAKQGETVMLSPEEYLGYEALEKTEREKQKELREKRERITREFEEMHPIAKGLVSVGIGFKNIPDIAELTWLKATGQEEKWREKRAEMLAKYKGLGKEIVKTPTKGVPKALAETFTEGAGQLPLYAGLGRLITPVVGGAMAKASQIGVKTGAVAKGVVYGLGVTAVAVPSIDVTMEGIRGNMRNVVRKTAQYTTEFGAFTLGAISSQPLKAGVLGGKKLTGRFARAGKLAKGVKPSKPKAPIKTEKLPKTWAQSPEWTNAETVHQNVIRQMKSIQRNLFKPLESRGLSETVRVKFPKQQPLYKSNVPTVPKTKHYFVLEKYAEFKPRHIALDVGKTIKLKGARIQGLDEYGRVVFKKGNRLYYLETTEMKGIHPDYTAYRIISVVKGKPKVIAKGFTKTETIRNLGEVALEKTITTPPKLQTTKPRVKTLKDVVKGIDDHYSSISKGLSREGTGQKLRLKAPKTEKSLTEKMATKTATKQKLRLKVKAKPRTLTEQIYAYQKMKMELITQMKARQKLLSSLGITLDQLYRKGVLPIQTQKYRVKLKGKTRIKEQLEEEISQEQDIGQELDQQMKQITKQITQQKIITQQITNTIPSYDQEYIRIEQQITPVKPKIEHKKKGGGGGIPMLPFTGVGIGAIDSQYRTVTKHIKHNIPKVEKLLEL